MDKAFFESFNNILSYISPRIQLYIKKMSEQMILNTQEIRLRSGRPVVIVTPTGSSFLTLSGKTSLVYSTNCVITSENEILDTINKMCEFSMHSHYEDILNGYITLPNGSRVGLCGTAVYEKDVVKSIKNISSINIRIPRNIKGASGALFDNILNDGLKNIVVIGPPSSGKTTILRDLAFQLSSGRMGKYYKISVIDERKELFPSSYDINNLGPNTDVLSGFPKGKGIQMAVRTLSPDVIICDEIGSQLETSEVINSVNCGVKFALSAHADSIEEFLNKESFKEFIRLGIIDFAVLLLSSKAPGSIKEIVRLNEVYKNDNYSFNNGHRSNNFTGIYQKDTVSHNCN